MTKKRLDFKPSPRWNIQLRFDLTKSLRHTMAANHDSHYKLLFSHPELIHDLLVEFVSVVRSDTLRLDTLQRVNGSYTSETVRCSLRGYGLEGPSGRPMAVCVLAVGIPVTIRRLDGAANACVCKPAVARSAATKPALAGRQASACSADCPLQRRKAMERRDRSRGSTRQRT